MKYFTIEDPDNTYVGDIETDSLSATKIHCAVFKNKGTRRVWRFINDGSASIYHDLKEFFDERKTAIWVGHNFVSFDAPVLGRLCGFGFPFDHIIDSLVLSYLYNPALEGGHSLESYGERLQFPKVEHTDWTTYTPEMLHRCEVDVDLTELVYDALARKMNKIGYSELAASIEHDIRHIIDIQESNGFWVNRVGIESLCSQLQRELSNLSGQISGLFPPKLEEVATYPLRRKKDGSYFASYERHLSKYPEVKYNSETNNYTTFDYKSFNIGSPAQRLERLLDLGFEPTKKTKKGNPQVDEDSLVEFANKSGIKEVQAIADWLVIKGRLQMIAGNPNTDSPGWLGFIQPDGRIHGKVLTCGTTTRRMIHNNPNIGTVPSEANGARYGRECRELWGVDPSAGDRWLCGYDATGLETVGFCHYLNNKDATAFLTTEDIHTKNKDAISEAIGRLIVRGGGGAKTLWYAFLYGAYDPKLGAIIKGSKEDGAKIRQTLLNNVPGLGKLTEELHSEFKYNNCRLRTIDGGSIIAPSLNTCLNYKIQSLGGIVMKLATIILTRALRKAGVEHMKVLDSHDEGQHDCPSRGSAEALGPIAVKSIGEAAETLNFRLPLTGAFAIGKSWHSTH